MILVRIQRFAAVAGVIGLAATLMWWFSTERGALAVLRLLEHYKTKRKSTTVNRPTRRVFTSLTLCRAVLSNPDFSAAPARLQTSAKRGESVSVMSRLSGWVLAWLAGRVALVRLSRNMLLYDDVRHAQLRKTVYPVLLSRALVEARLGAIVEREVSALAKDVRQSLLFAGSGNQFDFMARFGVVLPWRIASHFAGFPVEDIAECIDVTELVGDFVGSRFTVDRLAYASAQLPRVRKLFDRWEADYDHKVQKTLAGPADDEPLFDRWFRMRVFSDRDDLHGNFCMFLFAATHNLENVLGNGIRLLLTHPEQLSLLKAQRNTEHGDSLLDDAVDEIIRVNPPIRILPRIATKFIRFQVDSGLWTNTEAEPQTISVPTTLEFKQGEQVLLSIWEANRCTRSFGRDANAFDITRPGRLRNLAKFDAAPPRHLSFGFGPHACMGNALGRVAMRHLIDQLLLSENLLPGLRLADANAGMQPEWKDTYTKLDKLHLVFDSAS